MADLMLSLTQPMRTDAAAGGALPAGGADAAQPDGDSGFAIWPAPTSAWQALATAPVVAPPGAPMAQDAMLRWLEDQTGFSVELAGASDPAMAALDAALPSLDPAVAVDPATGMPGADGVEAPVPEALSTDAVSLEAASPEGLSLLAGVAADAGMAARTRTAPTDGVIARFPAPGPGPDPAPGTGPGMADGPVATTDRPSERAASMADRPADPAAQAPRTVPLVPVESSVAPEAGMAEPLARADQALPAGARGLSIGGPAWQAAAQDPRPILSQVAEAVVTARGDRTEIALSPEELGRIRLVLSGADRGHVTIWADRPETLELVRRHADLLTQHLAEAGVDAGSLEFRRDDRADWPQTRAQGSDEGEDLPTPAMAVALSPTRLSDRRLDIRL